MRGAPQPLSAASLQMRAHSRREHLRAQAPNAWPAAGATRRQVLDFMGRRVLRRDRIDAYLSEHANVQVSHGLCPECLEEHYPEPED